MKLLNIESNLLQEKAYYIKFIKIIQTYILNSDIAKLM